MNGYDYVIGILEDAIKSDENLYYTDYIVHIRKKYEYETEWEESNEYVEFVCDHWEWQSDWYGYQENIEVLGFDMVDNLKITNRFPIKSNKDGGGRISNEEAYELGKAETRPCQDCISRKETLNKINALFAEYIPLMLPGWNLPLIIGRTICGMPPVTPQQKATGSWVGKQVIDNEEVEIKQWQSARCSKCDKYHTTPYLYYFDDYNYCPNCGAKMEVE